jgi:hypothetical protein
MDNRMDRAAEWLRRCGGLRERVRGLPKRRDLQIDFRGWRDVSAVDS